jgi:hypothetical protein
LGRVERDRKKGEIKMKVCDKCRKAEPTFVVKLKGEEFDLCEICITSVVAYVKHSGSEKKGKFMKILIMLFFTLSLVSCATMTETIPGYDDATLSSKAKELKGSNRDELVASLGKPISEGLCNHYDSTLYKMVYLRKNMPRYSYALDKTNKKVSMKCALLTLRTNDGKDGQHRWSGRWMSQTMCNHKTGQIDSVRKCKQIYKK